MYICINKLLNANNYRTFNIFQFNKIRSKLLSQLDAINLGGVDLMIFFCKTTDLIWDDESLAAEGAFIQVFPPKTSQASRYLIYYRPILV